MSDSMNPGATAFQTTPRPPPPPPLRCSLLRPLTYARSPALLAA